MRILTRRTFLGAAGAAGFAAPAQRPNVVLLMTDQQANWALSFNGNPWLRTPALDSLAADGVSFTESYCAYPLCSPARSSIFTSRMPHETGVRNNSRPIAPEIPTLGEIFRQAGYRTFYGGKWHLPNSGGNARGFETIMRKSGRGGQTDAPLSDACIELLGSKPESPFLLVASFVNPHDICDWIREHAGSRSYADLAKYPPAPRNMAVDPDEPEYIQYHRTSGYNLGSQAVGIAAEWKRDDIRFYLHSYYRLVETADREIGRVLSGLRSTALYDNTLVVMTTDHGEGMGAHRWSQKLGFWEETAKVPLIVSGAGIKRRGVRDERSLVSAVDILPTLCDYTGVPAPAIVRGRSLRPALEGAGLERPFVVCELSEYGKDDREGRMLRTARYKYVVFNGGQRPEQLFDLHLDPGEVSNLASRAAARSTLDEHRTLLARWLQDTQDDFRAASSAASAS